MGMAGNVQHWPKFDRCSCGKNGFKEQRDATTFMLNKHRVTEPAEMLRCPVGDCFHVYNPGIRDRSTYLKFLIDTQNFEFKPKRPELPAPSAPLTQQLPIAKASIVTTSTNAPPSSETSLPNSSATKPCFKIKYASKAIAEFTLANMPEGRDEVKVYECTTCGKWHLTSKEFAPSEIVEEELVTFGKEPYAVTVSVGKYPDGQPASLNLRGVKGQVRVNADNIPQLLNAIRFVSSEPTATATPTAALVPTPALRAAVETPAAPNAPKAPRAKILEFLESNGPATIRAVAAHFGITDAHAAMSVKTLRKLGSAEEVGFAAGSYPPSKLWRAVKKTG